MWRPLTAAPLRRAVPMRVVAKGVLEDDADDEAELVRSDTALLDIASREHIGMA